MKYLALSFAMLFFGWSVSASSTDNSKISSYSPFNNYGEAFIFVEGGVEFAIYRNGEFDFYYDAQFSRNYNRLSIPNGNISYNSGYNYDPYVQYDDYGAVIQIENVPVYYDYYGRIIQAGNIFIDYNRYGNISRVGGLRVKYNSFHQPIRYSGYINSYNTRYVYQPWHKYYSRPHSSYRVVYYEPYRAYYEPIRVNYVDYNTFYSSSNYTPKGKNDFYRPGRNNMNVAYNKGRRTSEKRGIATGERRSSESVGRKTNAVSTRDASLNNRGVNNSSVLIKRNADSRKEISNNERHAAAVRSNTNSTETARASSVNGRRSISTEISNVRSNSSTANARTATAGRTVENTRTPAPAKVEAVNRGRTQTPARAETAQRSQSTGRTESVRTRSNTSDSRSGRSSSSRNDSVSSVRKR